MKYLTIIFPYTHPKYGKILLYKLWSKVYSSSHIAGFFDRQYLWKKLIDIFDFSHGDFDHGKVASETATFGIPSRPQTCHDLPRVLLGSLEGTIC